MNKDILHELFEYRDGFLIRKIRTSNFAKLGVPITTIASNGYIQISVNNKLENAHRIIFMMHHGYMPELIDHINGIKTDNKIENLRAATSCQNKYNTKLRADNKSGIKGISWSKRSKKWHAYLSINNKRKNIGFFKDIFEAEKQVIYYRQLYHGEFANNG